MRSLKSYWYTGLNLCQKYFGNPYQSEENTYLHRKFEMAAQHRKERTVLDLLESGTHFSFAEISYAAGKFAEYGHATTALNLLKHLKQTGYQNFQASLDRVLIKAAGSDTGNLETVQALLALGADPRAEDSHALKQAAFYNRPEICRSLIKAGADVLAEKGRALGIAADRNLVETAEILLAGMPIPDNEQSKEAKYRAFAMASQPGCREVLELIKRDLPAISPSKPSPPPQDFRMN